MTVTCGRFVVLYGYSGFQYMCFHCIKSFILGNKLNLKCLLEHSDPIFEKGKDIMRMARISNFCTNNFLHRAQQLTHKSYSNKSASLLTWSYHCRYFMIIITNLFTVTKYPILKWQWILYLLRRIILSTIT